MRTARITMIAILITFTVSVAARGQHSLTRTVNGNCGCNACAQSGAGSSFCPSLLPCLTESVSSLLGSLLCCPGLDPRHDIYRAALHRNDFGKCNRFLPFYSCRKCGCGGVSPGCQSCGHQHAAGEEVMDMQAVPEGMPVEMGPVGPTPAVAPTPAADAGVAPTPAEVAPAKEARRRVSPPATSGNEKSSNRAAAPRNRLAVGNSDQPMLRPVAEETKAQAKPSQSPVRHVSLFEAMSKNEPANPLRK